MFKFLKSVRFSFVLLAVMALLIFLHFTKILLPIENLTIRIFSPVQYRIYRLGSGFNNLYSGFSTSGNLKEENKKLQEEVKGLAVENSYLLTFIAEQQEISVQENFLESSGFKAVVANVIGKSPEANEQSIILNKGSKNGIKIDQPLITSDGILVGKISEVRTGSSKAILINDPRSKIAALVQNETNSPGVVTGEHGLSLKMELIPQNENIAEGDLVITSGVESTIARGLIIGRVNRIVVEPNLFFQTAFLQPMLKVDNLTVVSVLMVPNYDE